MNEMAREIFRSLLGDILSGRLKPGDGLLPEVRLSEKFGTTRMNAHRAVKQLEQHGLVLRRKRVGTVLCDGIDGELVTRLLNEFNRVVYVLFSSTPHWIHWNETSFQALEEELAPAGYTVRYAKIPSSGTRLDYINLLEGITSAGASALVVFPDMEDTIFLNKNSDLLLDFQMPVYMLNRSGAPIGIDMVSFVSVDPFGDGVAVGMLLQKHGCRHITMLNENSGTLFWGIKRYEGLLLGLRRGSVNEVTPENIPGDETGFAKTAEWIRASRGEAVVVAVNNEYAAGFIDFAQARGLTVPGDYRLISFDDNPRFRSRNLTTMAIPVRQIGQLFGKLINDASWLKDYRGKVSIKVNSTLVFRETFREQVRSG